MSISRSSWRVMRSEREDSRFSRAENGLRWSLLGLTLALPCLTGFATSYLLILLAAVGAGFLFARRIGMVFDRPAQLFFAAFTAIAILFALSARQPADMLFAFNFTAFLIYAPLAALFGRAAGPINAEIVARLALLGTAIGLMISVVEVFLLGTGRAGIGITDTIRLGDTALLLGFLALMGLLVRQDGGRFLYLLGPALALPVVLLTGARGAMLAFPALSVAAALILIRRRWTAVAPAGALVLVIVAAALLTDFFGNARLQSMFEVFRDIAAGNALADESVRIRIELYKAGWAAFQQSPLFGHGWAGLMRSVEPFLADADKIHATLPHLHNDVLNFAVFGGIAGVAVYLLLIAMPIAFCLWSPRDGQYRARLFGSILLVVGYVVMGLPDTMLSFELHTALYVALVAILLAFCRDRSPPSSSNIAATRR